ncbi:energy transducer TonB [Autumnicola psychrophila]|uniref:energy transducer TonB n=1 Tax=Autumnicola psychrophila TaxID=3075592 RepID=UPI003D76C326
MKRLILLLLLIAVSETAWAFVNELDPFSFMMRDSILLSGEQAKELQGLNKNLGFNESIPDFSANGLNFEIELTDIFMGNFEDVPFKRDELFFNFLFNAYVTEYAKNCDSSLPPNKIELTKRECSSEEIVKNGYGITIRRNCVSWRTVGTGYFAAPKMYTALQTLEQFLLGNVLSMAQNADVIGASVKMTGEMKSLHMDMAALVRMNGCDSPGLKRFQENLRLFAHDLQPMRIESMIAKRKEEKTEVAINQDVKLLVEDLVYENSRQWNFNTFHKGSVDQVQIVTYDSKGRPGKLTAEYLFTGFSGKKKGSVTVTFNSNGFPYCLYFFDFPSTCRPASRKIVNTYAKNGYMTKAMPKLVPAKAKSQQFTTTANNQEVPMDVPFAVIENVPIFPGCDNEINNAAKKKCTSQKISEFMNQNFNTRLGNDLELSGINRVFVQFRIDHNGNIADIKSRAPHPALGAEAERVVKLLPKMIPGKQRGRPVGVLYSLPIVFQVIKNESKKEIKTTSLKREIKNTEAKKSVSSTKLKELFHLNRDK